MPSAKTTLKGMRNRDFSSVSTVPYRYLPIYIQNPKSVAPAPANLIYRFSPDEDLVLIGFQASANSIATGITTFSLGISNASGLMLTATISLKSHAQEVVKGIVHATNNVIAQNEVATINVTSSNNENVFDVSVLAVFRPYVGQETRVL